MLKNILLAILTFISSLFGIKNVDHYPPAASTYITEPPSTIASPPQAQNVIEKNFENKDYLIYYTKISGKEIELIPNFSQKRTSSEIIKEARCKAAINGGFYSKEGEPLGLFIANGKVYAEAETENKTLLAGFFSLDDSGQAIISSIAPEKSNFAFQAGPLIINSNKLSTVDDKPSRRSVLAESLNGEIYTLEITDKEDQYSGPTLSDLPAILFSIIEPFQVNKALNLDGGSASVYLEESGFALSELQTIGSMICVR